LNKGVRVKVYDEYDKKIADICDKDAIRMKKKFGSIMEKFR